MREASAAFREGGAELLLRLFAWAAQQRSPTIDKQVGSARCADRTPQRGVPTT